VVGAQAANKRSRGLPLAGEERNRDADLGQVLGVADPRQLQDVPRADRTRRQDHLAAGLGPLATAPLAIPGIARLEM
jgi:hypothetical protein